jgi:hypothetical protein
VLDKKWKRAMMKVGCGTHLGRIQIHILFGSNSPTNNKG